MCMMSKWCLNFFIYFFNYQLQIKQSKDELCICNKFKYMLIIGEGEKNKCIYIDIPFMLDLNVYIFT